MIAKRPDPSVIAARTRSIRTGLAASTVTPGSTPPDESWTTPTMLARSCASAAAGMRNSAAHAATTTPGSTRRMSVLRVGAGMRTRRVRHRGTARISRDTRTGDGDCQRQNVDFPMHYGEDGRLLGGESDVRTTLSGVLIAIAAA